MGSPADERGPARLEGLTDAEAARRLLRHGPNALPEAHPDTVLRIFLRQFLNPLIYILVVSAIVSAVVSDIEDAIFIVAVLLINGIVGTIQEYSAGKAALALRKFERIVATVFRDGRRRDVDARDLVPGDCVLLEAGRRVPADLLLFAADGLRCDESLLTGESAPTRKCTAGEAVATGAEDRQGRAFAGTLITRGTGTGEVIATGLSTEMGKIATSLERPPVARPPLLARLDRFSRMLAIGIFVAILVMVVAGLVHGMSPTELFMASVGLAVSAIPEGLPVAITVALAIAMRRMAHRHVIIRNMPAIEALGACTMIATDKTGTLTMNELTVTDILLPDGTRVSFEPHGRNAASLDHQDVAAQGKMAALLRAAVLPNEASLARDGEEWVGSGDAVDLALLAAARRGGLTHASVIDAHPLISRIAYEPERKYAASFHEGADDVRIFVKGAPETLIDMAETMLCDGDSVAIDRPRLLDQKYAMATEGLRVLAFAEGRIGPEHAGTLDHRHLAALTFLGLAGMKDPLRAEVPQAIAACRAAGIRVAMITGDDPATACAIARDAGLDFDSLKAATGADLRRAEGQGLAAVDALTRDANIYARVEPLQKLGIVESMARNGHIVAVTGDGINDAPALKHAHVGVAMGRKGTDIARESADIILSDDNFASIVSGVREGRVAYANIRKVIFMSVSTGAAEVLLFLLTVPFGMPIPLVAVQLLWLNLVTNGIQDVALAAEKAEGDELAEPPRRPDGSLFDRMMVRRIVLTAIVMATSVVALFIWNLNAGKPLVEARNELLLQFVIFENVLTLCARSERRSLFSRDFLSNPLLIGAIVFTLLLHVSAMYLPGLRETLRVAPVSASQWLVPLVPALLLVAALELDKFLMRRRRPSADLHASAADGVGSGLGVDADDSAV
jgi:Ca2+-transporting ATPase